MLVLAHLGADAEKVLDVVADLMGDHIGLRQITRGAEPAW